MSAPISRRTVLDGYYRSGDHECFCFDKWDGPDAYIEAFPHDDDKFLERTDAMIAAQDENRVYPHELLPDGASYGRWEITVAFTPMEPPA